MKVRIFSILSLVAAIVCVSFLGFRLFRWYEDREKRRELFVYLQSRSPIVKRLPADTRVYINLYDLKRVYSELQDARFYQVLAHWFDTGMSDSAQRSSSLLGGMVEKTIVDTIGNEFGIAIVPSSSRGVDFLAIAKPESGSGFILRLALASAKKARRIDFNGTPVYVFATKDGRYPEIFVYLADDFAFASSDLERIKTAAATEGSGPQFLKKLNAYAVPADTFLFMQSDAPVLSAIGYGAGHQYRVRLDGDASITSHLPEMKQNGQTVFQLQTNGPEILNQPATTFSIESDGDDPVSHLLLTFAKPDTAREYSQALVEHLSSSNGEAAESFSRRGFDCFRYNKNNKDRFVCSTNAAILLAEGRLDLQNAGFKLKGYKAETLPLTVRLHFRKDPIAAFYQRVEAKDWSLFERAKAFYFLSCIQDLSGRIDETNREIAVHFN